MADTQAPEEIPSHFPSCCTLRLHSSCVEWANDLLLIVFPSSSITRQMMEGVHGPYVRMESEIQGGTLSLLPLQSLNFSTCKVEEDEIYIQRTV